MANNSKYPVIIQEKANRLQSRSHLTQKIVSRKSKAPIIVGPPSHLSQITSNKPSYFSDTSRNLQTNPQTISAIKQVNDLLPNILFGNIKIKDALVIILTVLPLIINLNM